MISIIIPVYNAEKYISDMLDSVIRQSYTDIEIILVNDGSTDNSCHICHQYADKYNYIEVYDQQNRGVSSARNFGLEHANGEFVWFMDSDDILEKDALINAVRIQEEYDADMVIGGMNFCFKDENKVIPKTINRELIINESELKFFYKELFMSNYISPLWNKLIRRRLIVENSIKMNESLCMYEDYVFCMDVIFRCKKVICIKNIFYNYMICNSASLSRGYKDKIVDMFLILHEKIENYRNMFGYEIESTDACLIDSLIYMAYVCVKNEACNKNSYRKIRMLLNNKEFHNIILNYRGVRKQYRSVLLMMKKKMTLCLLIYLRITGKIQ